MKFRFVLLSLFFIFASCTTPKVENNKVHEKSPFFRDFESTSIIKTPPDELAKSNFNKKNIIFYISCVLVGCNFVIEGVSEEETECIRNSYKTKHIDAGYDMIFSEEQARCQDKIENWVREYNSQLISILRKSKK